MSDHIEFACSSCAARLRAPGQQAGKHGTCPKCGAAFVVPALLDHAGPAAPAPVPAPANAVAAPDQPPAAPPATRAVPPLAWAAIAAVVVVGIVIGVLVGLRGDPPRKPPATEPVTAAKTEASAEMRRLKEEQERLTQEIAIQRQKRELAEETVRFKQAQQAAQPPAVAPAVVVHPPPPPASPAATEAPKPRTIAYIAKTSIPSVAVVSSSRSAGNGTGAGFLAFTRDTIITNYHVVAGSQSIRVSFKQEGTGMTSRSCRVQAADPANDLALLVLADEPLPTDAVPLAFAESADLGSEVVAIGNPGMGQQILEHSVTNGIISALDRVVQNIHYIQTTAAINPGNSGGPLLDLQGKVVGIVSAKATQQENVGFAVPIAKALALYKGRDGQFKVDGDLLSWEAKMPIRDLGGQTGIDVGAVAADLYLDDDAKLLVATLPARNKVVVINLATNTIAKEIFAGTDPLAIQEAGKNLVWVSHLSSRNITLINTMTGKIERKVSLKDTPLDFTISKSCIWYMGSSGSLFVLSLDGSDERDTRLNIRSLLFNGLRNNMWCGASSGWLVEIDGDRVSGLFSRRDSLDQDLAAFQKRAERGEASNTQYRNLVRRRQELEESIAKSIKAWNQPPGFASPFAEARQQILLNDSAGGRIYFNGCAMEAKQPDKIIGVFKSPEHSMGAQDGLRELYAKFPLLRQIRAISPDGRYVSTGTHVFRSDDFTILAQLPVPSPAVRFSADSKGVWLSDPFNQRIVLVRLADITPPPAP